MLAMFFVFYFVSFHVRHRIMNFKSLFQVREKITADKYSPTHYGNRLLFFTTTKSTISKRKAHFKGLVICF